MCSLGKLLVAWCALTVAGVLARQPSSCYWSSRCAYDQFGTRTPYDVIRGDIRDWPLLQGCEVVSMWALIRHGNRNPGKSGTVAMKEIQERIKNEIVEKFDYEMGTSQLCTQDIDNFRKWTWNVTMDTSQSYLTGTGYEEIYDMATRIKEKYPQLLVGAEEQFYFRPTYKQRTITSAMAFVHALREGTSLNLTVDDARERDDILRPYDNCERYQVEVKNGPQLAQQLEEFYKTTEFLTVQKAVQQRLGIASELSPDDVYNIYELCRFFRTWSTTLKSPWCAAFSDQDLVVLEYRDDVRHYYRNAYGSTINANLARPVLNNLYESMNAVVGGGGQRVVANFAHDTLLGMVYSALGLHRDASALTANTRDSDRLWRTTYISSFSSNIMVFMNTCQNASGPSYKIQVFNNEMPTTLCPLEGCPWEEFAAFLERFTDTSLDFCNMNSKDTGSGLESLTGSAANPATFASLLILMVSMSI